MPDDLSNPPWSTGKLYHPKGVQVTFPFPADPALCLAAVTAALDAGWLVAAPGLEAGEEKVQVGYVVQGTYESDGEETPYVLLYEDNDAMTFSFLKVYLNTDADVKAFEYASRMKLDQIPPYIGRDKPERGASKQIDKFIIKAPKPFGVVFKANPKYDEHAAAAAKAKGEVYSKPKRLFVRWADAPPAQQAETPAQSAEPPKGAVTPEKVREMLKPVKTEEERILLWETLPDAVTDLEAVKRMFALKAKEINDQAFMDRQADGAMARDRR